MDEVHRHRCTSATSWPLGWAALHRHPVTELATAPLLVPDSLPADRLLERMRQTRTMAVVIDEYGGTAGVATVEDIVERSSARCATSTTPVEIPDPAARPRRDSGRPHGLGGRAGSLRTGPALAHRLKPHPDGPYETLAGLGRRTRRIPAKGDVIDLDGWRLGDPRRLDHHRADRLRVTAPRRPRRPTGGAGGGR